MAIVTLDERGRTIAALALLIVTTTPGEGAGAPRVRVAVPADGPSIPAGRTVSEVISKLFVAVEMTRMPRPSYV